MPYEIDMVTEFTYFENMLLGLADALHTCTGVKRTHLKKIKSLAAADIAEWEFNNQVLLPEDIHSFYLSANGYNFEWTYSLSGDDSLETLIGKIEIFPLEKVTQVYGYETTNNPGVRYDGKRYIIKLAPESKLFQLSVLPGYGKVVLVYLYPTYNPTIWLLSSDMTLFYMAENIATYLRMSITHLGIPNWQLRFTSQGLPQWALNVFRLIAPTLLKQNKKLEKLFKQKSDSTVENGAFSPNVINPSVFDPQTYINNFAIEPTKEFPILQPEKLEKAIKPEKLEKPHIVKKSSHRKKRSFKSVHKVQT